MNIKKLRKNLPYIIPVVFIVAFIIFKLFTIDITGVGIKENLNENIDISALLKEAKDSEESLILYDDSAIYPYYWNYSNDDIISFDDSDLKLKFIDEFDDEIADTLQSDEVITFEYSEDIILNGYPVLSFKELTKEEDYILFEIKDGNIYYLSDTIRNKNDILVDVNDTQYVYVLAGGISKEKLDELKNNNIKIKTNSTQKEKALLNLTKSKEDDSISSNEKKTCYLSIECLDVIKNIDDLKEEKKEYIPKDGYILKRKKVSFYEGQSVYDVLKSELKRNNIMLDASGDNIYSTVYVKGINHLYEFDCGTSSGWVYSVNQKEPNYGCSNYILKENDEIIWKYVVRR